MVALAITEDWVESATVTVASPTPTAVTTPSALTVATASSDDDHTTDVTVASTGSCETLSVTLSPTKARRNTYGMLLSAAAEASTIIRTFPPFNVPLDREEVEAAYAVLSRGWVGSAYREQPLPAAEEGSREYEKIYLSVAKTPLVKSYRKNQ